MNLFNFKNPHPRPLPEGRGGISETEKLGWLRLFRAENVGPVTFYRLMELYGSAERALNALPELSRRGGRKKPLTAPPLAAVEKEYELLKKRGGDIVTIAEEDYPLPLAAIDDAPPVISILGDIRLAAKTCIAMVGARNASLNGRKLAEKLSRELGQRGVAVASGLARGIDTAAHIGSLETGTIAVVAGGIDIIYPQENAKLYEAIKERGLIIAESPLGVAPVAQSFPRRNRIVSGLSKGVVVVEATMRSGSLITARLAAEQGRDVYAAPGHPLDPRAEGTNHLIREGATLVRDAGDVMEAMQSLSGRALSEPDFARPVFSANPETGEEPPEEAREIILSALSFTPSQVDELVRTCNLSVQATQTILLELELAGRIKRHHGNRISLLQE